MAVLDQAGHDLTHRRHRDREPDTGVRTRRGGDSGIYAYDFPSQVQEWPTGVTRVDGRVGLNDLGQRIAAARCSSPLGWQTATQAADDAQGHRALCTERVAYGNDKLTDPDIVCPRQRQGPNAVGQLVDLDHSQVAVDVSPHQFSGRTITV